MFLAKIFLLTSVLSWICFGTAELGLNGIPVLYPIGVWLHEYWFADYSERLKRHYGNYAIDGPPMVATPGQSGTIGYPYVSFTSDGNHGGVFVSMTYDDAIKATEKYTPVNGLFGVTNNYIKGSPTSLELCYPGAQEPNDYIAHRLLGDDVQGYSGLRDLGVKSDVGYNKNVFKKGSPFKAAVIGPNVPDDPRWLSMVDYQAPWSPWSLLIPQTTKSGGTWTANQQISYFTNPRDYSGGERPHEGDLDGTNEGLAMEHKMTRPYWYQQDQNGNIIDLNSGCATFPGENPKVMGETLVPNTIGYTPFPEFTTPAANFPIMGGDAYSGYSPGPGVGWGETNTHSTGNYWPSNASQQLDYIQSQLTQENPIPIVAP